MSVATIEPKSPSVNGNGQPHEPIDSDYEYQMQNLEAEIAKLKEKPARIQMSEIVILDEAKTRESENSASIHEYTQRMTEAASAHPDIKAKKRAAMDEFDPVIVFELKVKDGKDGVERTRNILFCGHHRFKSLKAAYDKFDPNKSVTREIRAVIVTGKTMEEAIGYAIRDNSRFVGARVTLDDWKRAAKAIFLANPKLSPRAARKRINNQISHVTLGKIKDEILKGDDIDPKAREEASKFTETKGGKTVPVRNKQTERPPTKKGFKEQEFIDSEWKDGSSYFPPSLEHIVGSTRLKEFAATVREFVGEMTKNKVFFQIPPKWLATLHAMVENDVLEESAPAKACPQCKGDGCGNCAESGFLPKRDCYPSRYTADEATKEE